MRITALAAAALTTFATTAMFHPTPLLGQTSGTMSAAADLGMRSFWREPTLQQLGKFDQYRDASGCAVGGTLNTCPTLSAFLLRWDGRDSSRTVEFTARELGRQDQRMLLRGSQPGLYDVQLSWDRIPHTFSTNGRSLGIGENYNFLPTPRPDTGMFNRLSPFIDPIRTRWDPVKLSMALTPNHDWDFKAEYTRTAKSGTRPMGMSFGSPGNNGREILEPIDQTMHDLKLTQGYARERFQLVATYNLSIFHNGIDAVTADNPQVAVNTATTGPAQGRTALAPSNLAHTALITGALNLPLRSRISGTASYGWWRQDASFIPPTINSAIVDPRLSSIAGTLHGNEQTQSINLLATSRPLQTLNFTARYRTFAFFDNTANVEFPVSVVNDRSIGGAEERERYPFARRNADALLTWNALSPVSVSAGYGWERTQRDLEVRNTSIITEKTPRVSVDFTGLEWFTLRTTFSRGWRRGVGSYHQTTTNEIATFRRFDQADRNRERVDFLAQVTPTDQVTLSGRWQIGHDEYQNVAYGVQSDHSASVGGDVDWAPSSRLSIGGGYVRELFNNRQQNRYRSGGTPGPLWDNTTWDWIGKNQDRSTTVSANVMAVLVPDQWEAGGNFEISKSRFAMLTYNPTQPAGTTAQITAATAMNLPEVTQTLQPLSIYLSHRLRTDWSMTLRYRGELFRQNDFRTNTLAPAMNGTYIFLGNNLAGYDARLFMLSLTYRPGLIRLGRSTL
jgi:MtrB/PioB family decaheme-associated outer membrane protein